MADNGFAAHADSEAREIHVDLPPSRKALADLFDALATSLGEAADGHATIRHDGPLIRTDRSRSSDAFR